MNLQTILRDVSSAREDAHVTSLVRACLATGHSKLNPQIRPLEYAKRHWNDDKNVDLILRAAVSPATLASTSALTQVTTAFFKALVPASAGADLLSRGIGLNFGNAASIYVPNLSIPTTGFLAEGQPIPVVTAVSSGISLVPRKLSVITVLSGELLRSSNAETIVKQMLIESTGPALDAVMFSSAAATAAAPAGLLNGIAALVPSAATGKTDALLEDLQALATAVAPAAGNSQIVVIAAPAQAVALALRVAAPLPYNVLTSASLAEDTIIVVAAAAVVSAVEGAPAIDLSSQASWHLDSVPGEIVDIGGVYARPVASSFQSDTIGLRLKWPISWGRRANNAIAWMQNTNW
jgi:hypothetical protein